VFADVANPAVDQLMQALLLKAVPSIIVFGGAAILLREFLNGLEREAKKHGRSRRLTWNGTRWRNKRVSLTAPVGAIPPPVPLTALPPPPPPPLALTLDDIGWENFELLAGEIFRRQGFEVEINAALGPDGGKDLTIRRGGEVRLVQCKRFSAKNKVNVKDVREFYGLLVAEQATGGIFMTTGLYSRDAQEFAEGKPIELLGRSEIEHLMASISRPGENLCQIRNWIGEFVSVATINKPSCPRCRSSMKLRRGKMSKAFWSCSSFPRCWGKRDPRTELVLASHT
jgi:ssDNA-binding Zn-finger/Zn-ribbon topoisomerase 1